MSATTIIIPNKELGKLRQAARKVKREFGIPHHQALDQVAVASGFNHWHHVVESAKLTSLTENAYFSGLVIAMDIKDAQDFSDPKNRFVEDDQFCFLIKNEFIEDFKNDVDEDGKRFGDDMSDQEIEVSIEEDMMNYVFYRFEETILPKSVEDVLKLVEECSFWPPIYLWLKGEYFDTYALSVKDSNGNTTAIRF